MTEPQLWPPLAPTALDYFRALVARDAGLPLFEAAASIAQDTVPHLDLESVLVEMESLAEVLRRRIPADANALHKLQRLNHYFFQELGFAGNLNNYYDPSNSHLHQVLQTRRGIPITLALIYVEIAQRIGLRARGVSFPGHFLVKINLHQGGHRGEVVIDPFSGRSLTRETLEEMLAPYKRQHRELEQAQIPLEFFLRPAGARDILARMLRNLKEIYTTTQDWHAVLAVCHRLVLLLPEAMEERRDRAQALEALGQFDLAADDLKAYLDQVGDGAQYDALRQRLMAWRDGHASSSPPP